MLHCQPGASSHLCLLLGMDNPQSQSAYVPGGNKKNQTEDVFHIHLPESKAVKLLSKTQVTLW